MSKRKSFNPWLLIISAVFVILGVVIFYYIKQEIYKDFQNEISFAADISLAAVDQKKIKDVSDLLPSDVSQSENFKLLKAQFLEMGSALELNGIDAIYVLTEIKGTYYFVVESTIVGEAGYVPPGAAYEQPPRELKLASETRSTVTTEKYTDEYGTYISQFVPIISSTDGSLVGILGVDVDYNYYNKTLLRSELMFLGVLFFIYLIFILAFLNYQSRLKTRLETKRNEEKIITIINTIYDGVIATSASGKIVLWNNACQKMFGYQAEKAVGKKFDDLVVLNNVKNVNNGQQINYFSITKVSDFLNQTLEVQISNQKNKILFLELIISTVDLHGSSLTISLFKDITSRKKREEDINKMNKLMVGRETKMIELKEEISALKSKFNL